MWLVLFVDLLFSRCFAWLWSSSAQICTLSLSCVVDGQGKPPRSILRGEGFLSPVVVVFCVLFACYLRSPCVLRCFGVFGFAYRFIELAGFLGTSFLFGVIEAMAFLSSSLCDSRSLCRVFCILSWLSCSFFSGIYGFNSSSRMSLSSGIISARV